MVKAAIAWDRNTQRPTQELGEFDNWNAAYKRIINIFTHMSSDLDPVAFIQGDGMEGFVYRNGTITKWRSQ